MNQLSRVRDRQRLRQAAPSDGAHLPWAGRWPAPAGIGLLALLIAFVGSWNPSFWDDEIATISAAGRSPADLVELLRSVDAVHGFYYFFMHAWTSVFGFSEVAMRLPSALAVGLACAGTVIIGRKLGSESIGVASGLVLAVLPRMVWAGTEARQSAFTALLAVGLTLLLIRAWESNRPIDWVLYGLCAVAGVCMFMFFALAVASHALAAIILRKRPLAVLITCAAAGAAVLPFLLFAMTQKAQVEWIQNRSLLENLTIAAVKQFFYGDDRPTGNLPPQWVLAFVLVLGLTQVGLVAWGLWSVRSMSSYRPLVVLSLTGVALPMLGLLLVSVALQPVYVARYLTFTAPLFALLVGLGLDRLRAGRRWLLPIAAALVVLGSLVPQLTIKSFVNEPVDTERQIAGLIASQTTKPASIVYLHPELRDMALAYPQDFRLITDLSLAESPADSGTLWGANATVTADQLRSRGDVWFVGAGGGAPNDLSAFEAAGCQQTQNVTFQRMALISFTCP
ncbi:glycosyltransferase family 39 protein [Arthrobacter oryzae]|uniref:glycosyltransferase family 39 protein n=1 Tax=Arthrobacter oryzae TaxID=409290 RepID=UPI00273CD271|nr:glycosyltransferase family 39 protein [Arthrobacter oryzae]WLQ08042.1 glycosyltransferase family 39 protein [Arthrobacter oryzae]